MSGIASRTHPLPSPSHRPTLIRVKRKRDELPLDAIFIERKRSKTEQLVDVLQNVSLSGNVSTLKSRQTRKLGTVLQCVSSGTARSSIPEDILSRLRGDIQQTAARKFVSAEGRRTKSQSSRSAARLKLVESLRDNTDKSEEISEEKSTHSKSETGVNIIDLAFDQAGQVTIPRDSDRQSNPEEISPVCGDTIYDYYFVDPLAQTSTLPEGHIGTIGSDVMKELGEFHADLVHEYSSDESSDDSEDSNRADQPDYDYPDEDEEDADTNSERDSDGYPEPSDFNMNDATFEAFDADPYR
eukprot:227013_1